MRKYYKLELSDLKKMNISLKRCKYFILCNGKYFTKETIFKKQIIEKNLILEEDTTSSQNVQLRLFS